MTMSTVYAKILPNAFLHNSTIIFNAGRIIIKSVGGDNYGIPIHGDALIIPKLNGLIASATLYTNDGTEIELCDDAVVLPCKTSHVSMKTSITDDSKMHLYIKFYTLGSNTPSKVSLSHDNLRLCGTKNAKTDTTPETDTDEYIQTATVKCSVHRFDNSLPTRFVMEHIVLNYVTALSA
jgi:hypothetical protein